MKRTILMLASLALCAGALAKLPEPTPEEKAKAELAKAQNAHNDKVAAYKTCLAENATAKRYFASAAGRGKKSADTPPCVEPGPFVPPAAMASAPASPPAQGAKK